MAKSRFNYNGGLVNIRNPDKGPYPPAWHGFDYLQKTTKVKPEHIFRTTVYNLEVEYFHTYYVGEAGLWAHDESAGA